MQELRLVDPNNHTVSMPGYTTVVTVADEDVEKATQILLGEPARAHADFWRQVALEHAQASGGKATVTGQNALDTARHFSVRRYRVIATRL
ncbi:hypothetical protein ACH4PU_30845 [Streptomyces sp. NPDC021100]|uniref:hypothetical protein n=1 Tax=Streptomyces sp. NPDC021100 TaxID=3365114 RepID=UPI0037A1C827